MEEILVDNILSLISARGFEIKGKDKTEILSLKEEEKTISKQLTKNGNYLLISVVDPDLIEKKTTKKSSVLSFHGEITNLIKEIKKGRIDVILISQAPLSTGAEGAASLFKFDPIPGIDLDSSFFLFDDLKINPINIYSPKYSLIPKNEMKNLKDKLNIDDLGQLNLFLKTDIVVKWYGWRKGDVIEIRRNDFYAPTVSKLSVNYRRVT